ncbi:MAG: tRNA (adenosine(37)-N6)-threonylcarbamoyltransferase complex dimerization subunit type 1 TsaB [Saprospiraceae bacterium]
MSLILHLECSNLKYSVALSEGIKLLCFEESNERNPIRDLIGMIRSLFHQSNSNLSDCKAISIDIGPGSYTSLRSGLSIAKGLAFSLTIPIIALPLSYILVKSVLNLNPDDSVITCIDSRNDEALFTAYNSNYEFLISDSMPKTSFSQWSFLTQKVKKLALVGENLDFLDTQNIDYEVIKYKSIPNAESLVLPAWEYYQTQKFADTRTLVPIYFKDPNITISKKILT